MSYPVGPSSPYSVPLYSGAYAPQQVHNYSDWRKERDEKTVFGALAGLATGALLLGKKAFAKGKVGGFAKVGIVAAAVTGAWSGYKISRDALNDDLEDYKTLYGIEYGAQNSVLQSTEGRAPAYANPYGAFGAYGSPWGARGF